MNALLVATLLLGTLNAEEPCWKLVSAKAGTTVATTVDWTFTIRNVSDMSRTVAEDWRTKGNASANLCQRSGASGALLNLLSEPCHGPQSYLKVAPGATITAVITDLAGFDRDTLLLTITDGAETAVVGTLSGCTAAGGPEPVDQPVPVLEPKAVSETEPAPELEGSPR